MVPSTRRTGLHRRRSSSKDKWMLVCTFLDGAGGWDAKAIVNTCSIYSIILNCILNLAMPYFGRHVGSVDDIEFHLIPYIQVA